MKTCLQRRREERPDDVPLVAAPETTPGSGTAAPPERRQLADLLEHSLSAIPVMALMLLYPFVARFFARGILTGAVKG